MGLWIKNYIFYDQIEQIYRRKFFCTLIQTFLYILTKDFMVTEEFSSPSKRTFSSLNMKKSFIFYEAWLCFFVNKILKKYQ